LNIDTAAKVISLLGSTPEADVVDVATALRVLSENDFEVRKNVSMGGIKGAPDWAGYETSLWTLGEHIRPWLKKRRDLRGRNALLDAINEIVVNPKFGKGRQNLILLLGDYGDKSYGMSIAGLLSDSDVLGHAIKALTKLGINGLDDVVSAIMRDTTHGWIRTASKKYLQKVGRNSNICEDIWITVTPQ
jgi:hypothetical protein